VTTATATPKLAPKTFDMVYAPVSDLEVVTEICEKSGKPIVKHILVEDEPIQATQRFWTSLFARYSINKAFFRYFEYSEVFDRISGVETNDRMRLCIERGTCPISGNPTNRLMAVSNPKKPVVVYDELVELVTRYGGDDINYADGIVESAHVPRNNGAEFDILGDVHSNRFIMCTPIDGYGSPNLYLSLLRKICNNGLIGYAKMFRASLALGKAEDDVTVSLTRALDGFNNDEGYAALRERISSSGLSWLSVQESQSLYKLITNLHAAQELGANDGAIYKGTDIAGYLAGADAKVPMGEDAIGSPIIKAFHKMTGDPAEHYGLANLDSLSIKRQRTLPVQCTVYDALNFATEAATHYAGTNGARRLQAWVGTVITEEYDMEGTKTKFNEFSDFLIDSKMNAGLTGSDYTGKNSMDSVAALN